MVNHIDCDSMSVDDLVSQAARVLLDAGKQHVGFRSPKRKSSMAFSSLPQDVVATIELKRVFERFWKSKLTDLSNTPVAEHSPVEIAAVREAESVYAQQQQLVSALLKERRNTERDKILKDCQGNSVRALRCFWSYVSHKAKSAVDRKQYLRSVAPLLGKTRCD